MLTFALTAGSSCLLAAATGAVLLRRGLLPAFPRMTQFSMTPRQRELSGR